jgi:hypothetical protein
MKECKGEQTMGHSATPSEYLIIPPVEYCTLPLEPPVFERLPASITLIKFLGICSHESTGASNPSGAIRDPTEPRILVLEYIGYTSSPS